MIFSYRATVAEEGETLLSFLRSHCKEAHSVKALKRAIDRKQCRVNGKLETYSTRLLKAKDHVEIELAEPETSLCVLYEDDDLLVCNKPPYLLCENRSINQKLPAYKGELQLIHRLDKETSGVLLIAKTERMRQAMIALFKERQVKKVYVAIVDKSVHGKEGIIENFLAKKQTSSGKVFWGSVKNCTAGLPAVTFWKVLKKGKKESFLQLEPQTGRTHQLRVHLAEMGHPILGDLHYGKHFTSPLRPKRHLLHAFSLAFMHPFLKKSLYLEAPLPEEFQKILATF